MLWYWSWRHLPEDVKQISDREKKETIIQESRTKQVQTPVKKTADGQTLLDVSQGNITIKSTGATGGASSETSLNPKGYRIKGTTTSNNIKVEPGVTTDITLVGKNVLSCGISSYGVLVKDGMDDSELIIQCEHAGEKGHQCTEESCGSLEAEGTATAIGNITKNREIEDESGFSNLTIKGGIIRAKAGEHNCAIGAVCASFLKSGKSDLGVTGEARNVVAVPDSGYQGYIQDGTSETEYNFTDESPFQEKQDIKVDKYFTVVYFGPFRDENKIDPDSKEQLGANHIISKTRGAGFTEEQLKELMKANGKDKDGNPFNIEEFTLPNKDQINAINEAKKNGEIGDYPLTIATEQGTQVIITVSLRGNGTDVTAPDGGTASGMVGANNVEKETGGEGFGIEEIKELCGVKGKDKDGNNLKLEFFKTNQYLLILLLLVMESSTAISSFVFWESF